MFVLRVNVLGTEIQAKKKTHWSNERLLFGSFLQNVVDRCMFYSKWVKCETFQRNGWCEYREWELDVHTTR